MRLPSIATVASTAFLLLACVGPAPREGPAPRTLGPGSEMIIDDVLERSDAFWSAAPFLHEIPLECPLASAASLPSPHHAFAIRAEGGDVVLGATLERPEGSSASADMGLGVYAGSTLPATGAAARDCLGIGAASGPFPGEAGGVSVADGASVVVVLWSYAGALPQSYRLTLRTD